MKRFFLILILSSMTASYQAQIGHTTITFNDPARTGGYGSGGGAGRQIQTEIYYPAATSADNVPVVGTNLPIIAFGHGFVMSWDSYDNIWTSLVSEGYVVAFPRTEGGFSPVHEDFGKDLAQIISKVQALNTNSSSIFFNKLATTSAIMGHSMGGGSSFIGATNNNNITTMVTMAAANTDPSSITAAQQISIPSLVISGVNDCVAPPIDHQDKMYDSLISTYKTQINIIGGGHCYFANNNFNCSFGEGTCTPNPTVSRAEQQDATMDLAKLWLRKFLKNDCSAAEAFQDSLASSSRITYRQNNSIACPAAGITDHKNSFDVVIYPNPANTFFEINSNGKFSSLCIRDLTGKIIHDITQINGKEQIDISHLPNGYYLIELCDGAYKYYTKLVKSSE